jgi:hypothetical protein
MADYSDLQYSSSFWREKLGENFAENLKKEDKLHLILSLIIFLATPFYEVLYFMFSSRLPSVQSRATGFMKPFKESGTHTIIFGPTTIYNLWHARSKTTRERLHSQIVEPCAHELALKESNQLIKN